MDLCGVGKARAYEQGIALPSINPSTARVGVPGKPIRLHLRKRRYITCLYILRDSDILNLSRYCGPTLQNEQCKKRGAKTSQSS